MIKKRNKILLIIILIIAVLGVILALLYFYYPPEIMPSPVINVKSFGVIGDGVADDTQAIQDAVNSLPSGGALFFPNGVYNISSAIQLVSNLNLIGEGESVLKHAFHSTTQSLLLQAVEKENISIDNLRFEGPAQFSFPIEKIKWVYYGIGIDSSKNITIKNSYFTNLDFGLRTQNAGYDNVAKNSVNTNPKGSENIYIFNNTFYNVEGAGYIGFSSARNVYIYNNKINYFSEFAFKLDGTFIGSSTNYTDENWNATPVSPMSKNVVIENNIFDNSYVSSSYIPRATCDDYYDCYYDGVIEVEEYFSDVIIRNNTFRNINADIGHRSIVRIHTAQTTQKVENVTIENNFAKLDGLFTSIFTQSWRNVNISNVKIKNNTILLTKSNVNREGSKSVALLMVQMDDVYPTQIKNIEFSNNFIRTNLKNFAVYKHFYDGNRYIDNLKVENNILAICGNGVCEEEENETCFSDCNPNTFLNLNFNENSGNIAFDSSGLENNGDIINGTWTTGFKNYGLSFNGNSEVNSNFSEPYDLRFGFTTSVWIKPDKFGISGGGDEFLWLGNGSATWDSYAIGMRNDYDRSTNRLVCFMKYNSTVFSQATTSRCEEDEWCLVNCVYDGDVLTIYKNGIKGGRIGVVDKYLSISQARIGSWAGLNNFNGTIDEVKIWARAFSESAIKQMYNRDILALNLSFDEGAGNTTFDSSDYGNNGTLNNTIWTSGIRGNALRFNKTSYIDFAAQLNLNNLVTISAWVYPFNDSTQFIISDRTCTGEGFSLKNNGVAGNINGDFDLNINSLPVNTWSYLTAGYNGSVVKIYINGIEANKTERTGSILNGDKLRIGAGQLQGECINNGGGFNGTIDEVKIWKRALTGEEVIVEYKLNSCGNKKCEANMEESCQSCSKDCGTCPDNNCPAGQTRCSDGVCKNSCDDIDGRVCISNCTNKVCGQNNGCGSKCIVQSCGIGKYCNNSGVCSVNQTFQQNNSTCTPDCLGKQCGDNNCGGSCGACSSDKNCQSGFCILNNNTSGSKETPKFSDKGYLIIKIILITLIVIVSIIIVILILKRKKQNITANNFNNQI